MVHGGKIPSKRVEFIDLTTIFNNRERFLFIQGQNLPFWEKTLIAERQSNFPPNDEN